MPLSDGPTTNSGTLNSLTFSGEPGSIATMPNTDGLMNGNDAMCWMFFVYLSTPIIPQYSVLLSYESGNGDPGFHVGVTNTGQLHAAFYDTNGNPYDFTSIITLAPLEWYFVGINFNKLWSDDQFDFFKINPSVMPHTVTKDTHGLGSTPPDIRLNAQGSVTLGGDNDDNNGFVGGMACIQFYNTSIIGNTQKEAVDLCDPNVWVSPDYGKFFFMLPCVTCKDEL